MAYGQKEPLSFDVIRDKKDQFVGAVKQIESEQDRDFDDETWGIIEDCLDEVFKERKDVFDPAELFDEVLEELKRNNHPEVNILTIALERDREIVREAKEGRLSPARHERNVLPLDAFRGIKKR